MTKKIDDMTSEKYLAEDSDSMVFGFDRITDEKSLAVFLQKIANPDLLGTLISRMDDQEIESTLHLFTGLMKKHLSEKEFHRLFMGDNK